MYISFVKRSKICLFSIQELHTVAVVWNLNPAWQEQISNIVQEIGCKQIGKAKGKGPLINLKEEQKISTDKKDQEEVFVTTELNAKSQRLRQIVAKKSDDTAGVLFIHPWVCSSKNHAVSCSYLFSCKIGLQSPSTGVNIKEDVAVFPGGDFCNCVSSHRLPIYTSYANYVLLLNNCSNMSFVVP